MFKNKFLKILLPVLILLSFLSTAFSQDDKKKREDFEKIYMEGIHYLADYDHKGKENFDKGITLIKKVAEQGYARAQARLGIIYSQPQMCRNATKDIDEAIRWFTLAVAQGDADAQLSLGVLYLRGEDSLSPDLDIAEGLLKEAKNNGVRVADDYLSELKELRRGGKHDNRWDDFGKLIAFLLTMANDQNEASTVTAMNSKTTISGSGYKECWNNAFNTKRVITCRVMAMIGNPSDNIACDGKMLTIFIGNKIQGCIRKVEFRYCDESYYDTYCDIGTYYCDTDTFFVDEDPNVVMNKVCR